MQVYIWLQRRQYFAFWRWHLLPTCVIYFIIEIMQMRVLLGFGLKSSKDYVFRGIALPITHSKNGCLVRLANYQKTNSSLIQHSSIIENLHMYDLNLFQWRKDFFIERILLTAADRIDIDDHIISKILHCEILIRFFLFHIFRDLEQLKLSDCIFY